MVYNAQGKHEESLKYNFRALKIIEKKLGPEHPDTAGTLNNIALVYNAQGKHEESLKYNFRALKIIEKKLGPEHPNTAHAINNIAGVYKVQGKHEESLKYNFRALKIREKKLGPEHPKTATTLNNIAGVYYAQGMANKAIEYYKKSLFILSKFPNHPLNLKVKRNLDILTRTGVFDTNDPDINNQALQLSAVLQLLDIKKTMTIIKRKKMRNLESLILLKMIIQSQMILTIS